MVTGLESRLGRWTLHSPHLPDLSGPPVVSGGDWARRRLGVSMASLPGLGDLQSGGIWGKGPVLTRGPLWAPSWVLVRPGGHRAGRSWARGGDAGRGELRQLPMEAASSRGASRWGFDSQTFPMNPDAALGEAPQAR